MSDDIKHLIDNMESELKKMQKHLSERPDDKLLKGYLEAIKDYQETGNYECKMAAEFIKAELDNRGIEVTDHVR